MDRGRRAIDITKCSQNELACWLACYPRTILREFQRHGVDCLMDVPAFQEILIQMPAIAAKIAQMAADMGIRICDEDLDQGDILASMRPGEV